MTDIRMKTCALWALALLIATLSTAAIAQTSVDSAFEPTPSRIASGTAEGAATLTPDTFGPAEIGDYTLTFTVGETGIDEGGGLLVSFPKAWFTNPVPRPKDVQTKNAEAPHYFEVSTSRKRVALDVAIERENFDGKTERFRKIVHITLSKGHLRSSDTVTVAFRNTTCPYIAGADAVAIAVDAEASGAYRTIETAASYSVTPGEPHRMRLYVPTNAVVGQPVDMQVTFFDLFDNLTPASSAGSLTIAVVPHGPSDRVRINEGNDGRVPWVWTPTKAVTGFAQARYRYPTPLAPTNTVVRVHESEPELNVYWGDLHSHSNISKDAIGTGDFAYARDVARLDFYGSSEHDVNDAGKDSITPKEWETIRKNVRDYYATGEFVTLLGYECSLPGGHHNVFYRGLDGVPWPGHRLAAVEAVWSKLNEGNALTIPHHPGIRWGGYTDKPTSPGLQKILTAPFRPRGGPTVDWSREQNNALRPLVEIYSKHGQSEYYDPDDPLSYEQVRFTPAYSVDGPHYAQDAWAMGVRVGAIAASDNHSSHPGLAHTGLTAVFARELTRDAIFDALLARRCYATTGERILMEFEIAGAKMGEEIEASGTVTGRVFIAAPSDIAFAEVMMLDVDSKQWNVAKRWDNLRENLHPDAPESVDLVTMLEESFDIPVSKSGTTVYLRCELARETNGRVARAWSSPIWLSPPK